MIFIFHLFRCDLIGRGWIHFIHRLHSSFWDLRTVFLFPKLRRLQRELQTPRNPKICKYLLDFMLIVYHEVNHDILWWRQIHLPTTRWRCLNWTHIRTVGGRADVDVCCLAIDCCRLLTTTSILLRAQISGTIQNGSPDFLLGSIAARLGGSWLSDGAEAGLNPWQRPLTTLWLLATVQAAEGRAELLGHGIVYHRVDSTVGVDAGPTEQQEPGVKVGSGHEGVDQD